MRFLAILAALLTVAGPASALTPAQKAAINNPCAGIVLAASFAGGGGVSACYNSGVRASFTSIPGYSFARASQETCTDLSGLITYAANNVPCVNSAGYAAWQAATNLETYSQNAFATQWTVTNGTALDGQAGAPDGTATATLFTDNVTSGTHDVRGPSVSFANTTAYTASIFAKPGTANLAQLTYPGGPFSAPGYADFNLTSCTVTASSGLTTALAQPFGTWCRISITQTTTSAAAALGFVAGQINSSVAGRLAAYSGTGTTISFWGAQVE